MSRLAAPLLAASLVFAACAGDDGGVQTVSRHLTADPESTTSSGDRPTTEPATNEPSSTAPPPSDSTVSTPADLGSSTAGAAGVGDTFYPEMGNGGYDVGDYSLDLTVDVEANTVDASTKISAVATQDLTSFHLDLHGLDVSSVRVDGDDASFGRTDDELVVDPTTEISNGTDFTVEVAYSGTPEPIDDPAVPFTSLGWQSRDGVVYVTSEPSGAPSWFPSNNHPSDKATFEFRVTHASDLTAVANGVQTGSDSDGETTTTTWVMDDPMATYLAAVYVGDFERRASTTDDGLRIRNYFPPEYADDLAADFDLTADVIDYYRDLFGAEYPFAEYGSIVLPFDVGFALENQTISVHGLDATDPYTIAHEILHQWAGNSVTVADWQDIWMLEGFATYLAYMYFEDRGLPSSIEPHGMYAALQGGDTVGPAEVPLDDLFGQSVYLRGGLALHALRTEAGNDTFRDILATYYERNAGEDVSTDEFVAIVDEIAGSDAVELLDDWLYGPTLPPFP